MVIPIIELEKGKKLRQYASKISSQYGPEQPRSTLTHSSKYRYRSNQISHNFTFSPRYDCQQGANINVYQSVSKERQPPQLT